MKNARGRGAALLLIAAAVLFELSAAEADPARFALIIGNNRGNERRTALRYAERDAKRVAKILEELGGFSRDHVVLLTGTDPQDVLDAIERLDASASSAQASGAARTLLFVYYSGHADGANLEFGERKLPFAQLRDLVEGSRATTKVLVVDACQSGGITTAKGGRAGPAFDIAIADSLDTSGMAILTSSAPGEKSHESAHLQSSYFTHYLLSGLRGTADYDGDKRITLGEVYHYAYGKTVVKTSRTVAGAQHPTYDYRITGRGAVVLTDIEKGESQLGLGPQISGHILVVSEPGKEIVTELEKEPGTSRLLSLSAGTYTVTLRRRGRIYEQELTLEHQCTYDLEPQALRDETRLVLQDEKGSARGTISLFAQYGLLSSALKQLAAIHQGIAGLRTDMGPMTGFALFSFGSGRVSEGMLDYRIRLFGADAKLAWRFEHSLLDLFVGLSAGALYGIQNQTDEAEHRGTIFSYGGFIGLDFPIWRALSACFFWDIGGQAFVLDDSLAGHLATRGSLGAAYSF